MTVRRATTALAAGGVVLLLAAGVTAAPATVALEAGGALRVSDGAPTLTTVPGYGERGTDVLEYADREPVTLSLPVRNTGPLPVTLTGASLTDAVLPLLDVEAVEGLPTTVAPGQVTSLRLRAVLRHCAYYHEREVQVYEALRLSTKVLGVSGGATVALPRPVVVHAPMVVGCPDRKLDRQAQDRRDVVDAA